MFLNVSLWLVKMHVSFPNLFSEDIFDDSTGATAAEEDAELLQFFFYFKIFNSYMRSQT